MTQYFVRCGITSGDLVNGIKIKNNKYVTETLVTHKGSNIRKIITREDIIIKNLINIIFLQ